MVWGCMGWNGVEMLAKVEGKMNAEQYVDISTTTCCLAWQNQELMKKISSSNRIMIPSTHPEELGNGLKNIISMFLTGQHSILVSMSLSTSEEHSRKSFKPIKTSLKEYGSFGKE
jgi:hypothetical protein